MTAIWSNRISLSTIFIIFDIQVYGTIAAVTVVSESTYRTQALINCEVIVYLEALRDLRPTNISGWTLLAIRSYLE